MDNINELLTSEQIEMLMNDLSHQDIVALFLMNEEDKYHFFVEKFNEFSNRHRDYSSEFDRIHDIYLELKASHKPERLDYFDIQDSCFEQMLRCYDYIKIYEILLTHV